MTRRPCDSATALAALLAGMPALLSAEEPPINFARDIRPILSNACFKCHGPDEAERKGGPRDGTGLRLDTEEGALEDMGGRSSVVPGHPEDSELIARIIATEEDEIMPPPKSGSPLTPEEVKLLERWIKSGAKYSKHWSYEPPVAIDPPKPGIHPIDAFIRHRLEKEKLPPQPEADRATLARLRGLAPEALARERPHFRDGRLEELLFRYRARNFGQTLNQEERERWQAHCIGRLHEGAGGGPTLQAWMQQIDTLAEQAMERGDERAEAVLGELTDWASEVAEVAEAAGSEMPAGAQS